MEEKWVIEEMVSMRRMWLVGRYVFGFKVGGEGRVGDINLGVMSK